MTNSKFHLFQLQKIDTRLLSLKSEQDHIYTQLESDPVLLKSKKYFDEITDSNQQILYKLEEIEKQIGIRRIKLEQSENNLYHGKITNPKELQDLQKEISIIRKQISDLEETQFDVLYQLESKQKELEAAKGILAQAIDENQQNNQRLHQKNNEISTELSKLQNERSAILAQLTDELIRVYDDLHIRKRGLAVSKVVESSCGICGGSLTPAENQQAKSPNSITHCPSCGRILYAD